MRQSNGMAVLDEAAVRIPASAVTFAGFRAWATSDAFPERGRFSFIDGELYVDMSPEELDTHNKVKSEIAYAIVSINHKLDLGEFYSEGTLVTNEAAELSTEPDATFVTWESFDSGRVRLTPRKDLPGHYIELVGTPDCVFEVVSRSSVDKDTRTLRDAYHRAGIPEYWLIDARYEEIDFQILSRRRTRYVAVASHDGWLRSAVFGRQFRLQRKRNRQGRWTYKLGATV
jgi:Uma2 family endonuclease